MTFLAAILFASLVGRLAVDEPAAAGDCGIAPTAAVDAAAWISHPGLEREPEAYVVFRCRFTAQDEPLVFDVSADERYELRLDGRLLGRGPDIAPVERWSSATYAPSLEPGAHELSAVVWRLGPSAPLAQQTWRLAFVLKARGAYDGLLTTGRGPWEVGRLTGTQTLKGDASVSCAGGCFRVVGTGLADERPQGWTVPSVVRAPLVAKQRFGCRAEGWLVTPSGLPEQLSRTVCPGRYRDTPLVRGEPFTVRPGETVRFLWDLEDYYCAYPRLRIEGGRGAVVRWGWAESLKDAAGMKGNRGAWKGKTFAGVTDEFVSDGRTNAVFTVPWWRAGRWCEMTVCGGEEPLTVRELALEETRYPLADEARFACDDPTVEGVRAICLRALQACSHEVFVDCPYYERQMYGGDMRMEAAAWSAVSADDRLIRRALTLFDFSRRQDGMMAMSYPSRNRQESATYTMCVLMTCGDYLRWYGDTAFLRRRVPGMRHALSGLAAYAGADGLLSDLPGWCYLDWVPEWRLGRPRYANGGADTFTNLLWIHALRAAAAVERATGDPAFAAIWEERARRTGQALVRRFWRPEAGLMAFSDDQPEGAWAEQVQALAILADVLPEAEADRAFAGLAAGRCPHKASPYFRHVVFQAYFRHDRGDLFLRDLDEWRRYVALDARTTFEKGVEFRSDCHAWCAHPLYHFQTGLAGVRSAADGFAAVEIRPSPGGLRTIRAALPHPKGGRIVTDLKFDGRGGVEAIVQTPVPGTFVWRGQSVPLRPGQPQHIRIGGE